MNEIKVLLLLGVIGLLFYIIYIIYKEVQDNKLNKELDENHRLYEEKQAEKEIALRKENSYKWNNKIQRMFDKKVKYKTNKPIKILLGDYHSAMAPFSNSILRSMGIETEVVPTASDIIDRIEDGNIYDLIITNNTYRNGESGTDVLVLKEKENFNIPIVVLTTVMDSRDKFLGYGFDDYIEKPLDEEKVKKTFIKFIKDLKFTKIKSNKS